MLGQIVFGLHSLSRDLFPLFRAALHQPYRLKSCNMTSGGDKEAKAPLRPVSLQEADIKGVEGPTGYG